jgi:hypothetical protein
MSEECARKHFATREKYQDAAVLSAESDGAALLDGIVIVSDDLVPSRNILLDITFDDAFPGSLAR